MRPSRRWPWRNVPERGVLALKHAGPALGERAQGGSVRADSVSRCASRSSPTERAAPASAASTTTWALVPLKPNELTPREPAALGPRGARLVGTATGSSSHGMCGFGVWKCRLRRDLAVLQRERPP